GGFLGAGGERGAGLHCPLQDDDVVIGMKAQRGLVQGGGGDDGIRHELRDKGISAAAHERKQRNELESRRRSRLTESRN
ncbi:MAG TPA: hypothetical protein DCY13_03180, partial [Verrucomicrobiales bacterium]|nr:hypothetical protein [Verrucomicrobiales bacterium]